jgi:hypothetical protein
MRYESVHSPTLARTAFIFGLHLKKNEKIIFRLNGLYDVFNEFSERWDWLVCFVNISLSGTIPEYVYFLCQYYNA